VHDAIDKGPGQAVAAGWESVGLGFGVFRVDAIILIMITITITIRVPVIRWEPKRASSLPLAADEPALVPHPAFVQALTAAAVRSAVRVALALVHQISVGGGLFGGTDIGLTIPHPPSGHPAMDSRHGPRMSKSPRTSGRAQREAANDRPAVFATKALPGADTFQAQHKPRHVPRRASSRFRSTFS
jgi:hypothetical protein